MTSDKQLIKELEEKHLELLEIALRKIHKLKGLNVQYPKLDVSLKGTRAGCYSWTNDNLPYELNYNFALYKENREQFLKQTVVHEFSHFLAHVLYDSKGHDKFWKYIMQDIFCTEPKRCHDYDVTNVKRKSHKPTHEYLCSCGKKGIHILSDLKHKKILSGRFSYQCKVCKEILVLKNKD